MTLIQKTIQRQKRQSQLLDVKLKFMEQEKSDAVFVGGMYLERVHPNAPQFIITNQNIHVEKMVAWLVANKHLANEKGYIRIVGKESQTKNDRGENKRYFQVDNYKSTPKDEKPVIPEYLQGAPFDDQSIPF